MSHARIAANTLLFLVLGVLLTPKANLGARTRQIEAAEQTQNTSETPPNTLPEHDKAQRVSQLYSSGIIAADIDSLPVEAVSFFEQAVELDSAHAPSLYELANFTYIIDKVKAKEYIKRAIAADSSTSDYHRELAKIYILDRQYDSAAAVFGKIVELEPKNPYNYQMLSTLYIHTDQPYSALMVLDSAQTRFGNVPEIVFTKRDLLSSLRMFDKAAEMAKSIADDYPYEVNNHLAVAELYAQQGGDSLALEAYDKALALESDNPQVLMSMCEYYQHKNNIGAFMSTMLRVMDSKKMPLEEKITIFNDYIRTREMYGNYYSQVNSIAARIAILYPNDFRAQSLYATHLVASDQNEQALKIYKDRLKVDSQNMEVYNSIIDLEAFIGRADSVDKYSTLALEIEPNNRDMHLRRAGVLQYMERYDEAEKVLLRAVKLTDGSSTKSDIYCSLGDIKQFQGQQKKAIKYYKQALKYKPDNILALNNYSYFLSTIDKDLEHALEMIEVVIAAESGNATYLDTKAWILYKMGEYEQAREVMRTAISLDKGGNAEIYIHYGDILEALNEMFMAKIYWQKALEAGYDEAEINKRLNPSEDK